MTATTQPLLTAPKRFGQYPWYLVFLYVSWAFLLFGFISVFNDNEEVRLAFLCIGFIFSMVALVLGSVLFYRLWELSINESHRSGLTPSIDSAGKALGYMFIPFFNIYWIFIALPKLSKDLNALSQTRGGDRRVSDGLGMTIPIILILGIIPFLGYHFQLIAGCILIPIYFYQTIQACRAIDQLAPGGGPVAQDKAGGVAVPPSTYEQLASIRSFADLFHSQRKGFNFHLLIFLMAVAVLRTILFIVFNTGIPMGIDFIYTNFFTVVFQILLPNLVHGVLFYLTFIAICYLVPRNWLLPLVWGLAGTAVSFVFEFALESLFYNDTNRPWEFSWLSLTLNYIYAILFVTSLILCIKLWGVRIYSLIGGAVGAFIIYYILNISLTIYFAPNLYIDFPFVLRRITFGLLLNSILGTAIYLAFYFHFRKKFNQYSDNGLSSSIAR